MFQRLGVEKEWFFNGSNYHHWQFHYYFWQSVEYALEDDFDFDLLLKDIFSRNSNSRVARFISYCSSPEFFIKNIGKIIRYFNGIQKYELSYKVEDNKTYFSCKAVVQKKLPPEVAQFINQLTEISIKYIFLQIFGVKGYQIHKSEYSDQNHKASFTVSWHRTTVPIVNYFPTILVGYCLFLSVILIIFSSSLFLAALGSVGAVVALLYLYLNHRNIIPLTGPRIKNGSFLKIIDDLEEQSTTTLKLQQQLRKIERLAEEGKMTNHIMHEIARPLMIVNKVIDEIEQQSISLFKDEYSNLKPSFSKGRRALLRVNTIIETLRILYQQTVDVVESTFKDTRIKDLLNHVEFYADHMVKTEGVDFQVRSLEPDIPIRVNRVLIQQVLINLIENAIQAFNPYNKYKEKKVMINVLKEKQNVYFRVMDNALGIALEDQPKLFKREFSTKEKGCGLGLRISKEIVDMHHGTIFLEKSDKEGSSFIMRIPIERELKKSVFDKK